jgi:hypothetical protein
VVINAAPVKREDKEAPAVALSRAQDWARQGAAAWRRIGAAPDKGSGHCSPDAVSFAPLTKINTKPLKTR